MLRQSLMSLCDTGSRDGPSSCPSQSMKNRDRAVPAPSLLRGNVESPEHGWKPCPDTLTAEHAELFMLPRLKLLNGGNISTCVPGIAASQQPVGVHIGQV
jgi:hypothetical protein